MVGEVLGPPRPHACWDMWGAPQHLVRCPYCGWVGSAGETQGNTKTAPGFCCKGCHKGVPLSSLIETGVLRCECIEHWPEWKKLLATP